MDIILQSEKKNCIKEMENVIASSNFFLIFKQLPWVINFPQKKKKKVGEIVFLY